MHIILAMGVYIEVVSDGNKRLFCLPLRFTLGPDGADVKFKNIDLHYISNQKIFSSLNFDISMCESFFLLICNSIFHH